MLVACNRYSILLLLLLGVATDLLAGQIKVAVASNFTRTLKAVAEEFEAKTQHKVVLISGSTGKLYAQIRHGAPYDLFFAADARRPKLLEQEGRAKKGSRFTYASGRLVLWSPSSGLIDAKGGVLSSGVFDHIALANPKLAPYGRAAKEVLQEHGLWGKLQSKTVRGENVGQAFQFVRSGNAQLGFVAYAQVNDPKHTAGGSYWLVPQKLYSPILQQAVILRESSIADDFINHVRSVEAAAIIINSGYIIP